MAERDNPSNAINSDEIRDPEKKRDDYLSWEEYFMSVALITAQRSKDPEIQVGACVVSKDNRIVGIGYNGMPKGCHDDDMPWSSDGANALDQKCLYVCPAEINAVLHSTETQGGKIYTTILPCCEGAKVIIQAGIEEVVYKEDKEGVKFDAAKFMFRRAKVEYRDSTRKRLSFIGWEDYFMSIAFLSAKRSKDPVTQVGACIVNKLNRIVGTGYNGMPNNCHDDDMPWSRVGDTELDKKEYYVCHAEMNAVLNKNSTDVRDCTIYTTLFPCCDCAKVIIQAGIKTVVYYDERDKPKYQAAKRMFRMAKVDYRPFKSSGSKILEMLATM